MELNPSYDGARLDLIELALQAGTPRRALDVGCYRGATGQALAARVPGVEVVGIELEPEAAEVARERLATLFVGPVEEVLARPEFQAHGRYDLILCGDVLEHLAQPERVLGRLVREFLAPGGRVVISVPNVAYYETFLLLARGRWPRRARGIFDRTHLRFFTRRELSALLEESGLRAEAWERELRLVERVSRINGLVRFVRPWLGLWGDLFAFQLRCRAVRAG